MPRIAQIRAREILDSKGDPTVEVELFLSDGSSAIDSAPSGASTGSSESLELRDGDAERYSGRGVLKAVSHVNEIIYPSLKDREFADQQQLDQALIELDGTLDKSKLGANAILPVSLAFARATAASRRTPLYAYISEILNVTNFSLPRPLVLLLEGGKHGAWSTDIQEFMVMPIAESFTSFSHTLSACSKVTKTLESLLLKNKYSTGVGLEGAFCPPEFSSNEEAIELICEAVKKAGFSFSHHFRLALDAAASEFYKDGLYTLPSEGGRMYSLPAWTDKVLSWVKNYPIYSMEDFFDQSQWEAWADITLKLGHSHQIVADDLTTTNVKLLQKAIDLKAANSVIIKPNQIGTLTETFSAIKLAKSAGFTTIVSHRGGETADDFISDLAVGAGCPQVKLGGLNRGERIAKYNRLLAIEQNILSG